MNEGREHSLVSWGGLRIGGIKMGEQGLVGQVPKATGSISACSHHVGGRGRECNRVGVRNKYVLVGAKQ